MCASRWLEAYGAGVAAPVVLGATHERALEVVPIEALTHAPAAAQPSSQPARGKARATETPMGTRMATRQTESDVRSVIETARLRLEPWNDSHFERFARFMRDPDVTRYIRAEPLDRGARDRAARALPRGVGGSTASASAR